MDDFLDDPEHSVDWNGRPLYYDRAGQPLTLREWAELRYYHGDDQAREQAIRVASTKISEVWVSTVWLGYNHSYDDGPPLIFETMSFGGEHDQELWDRYSTEAAALAGHDQVVAALRDEASDGHASPGR